MLTAIDRVVEECRQGENPRVVARLGSGWAVMAEKQVLPGYCLLYPDPVVPTLNDLHHEARARFLADMAHLGDAILKVTDAVRINYEILGNQDPALHAHIIPRYEDEPEELRPRPIWFYDWDEARPFSLATDGLLLDQIRAGLELPE